MSGARSGHWLGADLDSTSWAVKFYIRLSGCVYGVKKSCSRPSRIQEESQFLTRCSIEICNLPTQVSSIFSITLALSGWTSPNSLMWVLFSSHPWDFCYVLVCIVLINWVTMLHITVHTEYWRKDSTSNIGQVGTFFFLDACANSGYLQGPGDEAKR